MYVKQEPSALILVQDLSDVTGNTIVVLIVERPRIGIGKGAVPATVCVDEPAMESGDDGVGRKAGQIEDLLDHRLCNRRSFIVSGRHEVASRRCCSIRALCDVGWGF